MLHTASSGALSLVAEYLLIKSKTILVVVTFTSKDLKVSSSGDIYNKGLLSGTSSADIDISY